jgi:rRNA maturation endonuclease Nob1
MSKLIECDGCGRSFKTEDAAGMLAAIKGCCPSCGGRFGLAPTTVDPVSKSLGAPHPSPRPH